MRQVESMQTFGKRRNWQTIDDMEYRERAGKRKKRTGRKIMAAGVGLGSLAVRNSVMTKPGLPQEIHNVRTAFSTARGMDPRSGAKLLSATATKNPYGAALFASGATVATGLAVRGVGARQAQSARRDMQERRKQLARNRDLRENKVQRFGKNAAVGRRMDAAESVSKAARRFDPDARRRHNQGAVTGAAAVGAGGMSVSAYRELKRSNSIAEGKRGVFVTGRSAGKVAGAAGLAGLAAGNYRRANSGRNRRWE